MSRSAWIAVLFALAVAGCATPPAPPPAREPASPAAPPPDDAAAPRDDTAAFEARLRARALEAERGERLAEALWGWEALVVLRPGQAEFARQVQRLQREIERRIAALMARAAEDRRRGDHDRAVRGYLAALALDPRQATAADALRAIELERNEQRSVAGRFARSPLALGMPANGNRTAPAAVAPERNLAEHASMLAAQGELDAAIQLIVTPAQAPGADPALRPLLADLHFRRAEALAAQQPAQATAALREALRLDPTHGPARERLRELQSAPRARQ